MKQLNDEALNYVGSEKLGIATHSTLLRVALSKVETATSPSTRREARSGSSQ